jgi:galactokinase
MVKHELSGSAYRQRVAECRAAVDAIRREHSEVTTLRDVRPEWLELVEGVPKERARHVISENRRVHDFIQAARAGDLKSMGHHMVSSHTSLQRQYEVSCAELDFLVTTAVRIEGVFGARMTGGGFGGCTVNLMRPDTEDRFRSIITEAYQLQYGVEPHIDTCVPSPGAGPLPEADLN